MLGTGKKSSVVEMWRVVREEQRGRQRPKQKSRWE